MTVHEQWDIVSSVGFTALAVAEGRAIESRQENRLINDPYAADLAAAADAPQFKGPEAAEILQQFAGGYLGVRTRYFDEFFLRTTASGARQAVILASGLDTRAHRLNWPDGMRVFEIDQQKVIDCKVDTLRQLGAQPTAEWHPIPVDLRDDWATALKDAGFDTGVPTAWLAEGLLPYLPAAAEAQLLQTVTQFSAPGSRVSIEHFAGNIAAALQNEQLIEMAKEWGMDLPSLFSGEERPDADDELRKLGWTVRHDPALEVAASYGRTFSEFEEQMQAGQFLTAHLDG